MKNQKFGLMSCTRPLSNVGDFVQSIAARQFLPRVDVYRDREDLNNYDGDPVKMIMNGWYMHNSENWPPSDKIDPLFVSMHINASVYEGMTTDKSIEYFKKHEPIGCRDKGTVELLRGKGVDAYFTGCLTLTLGRTYKRDNVTDDIYIVDPLFNFMPLNEMMSSPKKLISRLTKGKFSEYKITNNVLEQSFTPEFLAKAKHITQMIPITSVEDSFAKADEYLKKLCNAKFVVTSRIHCALPCLAMGTPVIFLNGGNNARSQSRFSGIIELFNRIDVTDAGEISYNYNHPGKIGIDTKQKNKDLHVPLADALAEKCKAFLSA